MILVMLPFFLFAMYEKHGQPLEVILKHIVQTKFIRKKERPYRTRNYYAVLIRQRKLEKEVFHIVKGQNKGKKQGFRYCWIVIYAEIRLLYLPGSIICLGKVYHTAV